MATNIDDDDDDMDDDDADDSDDEASVNDTALTPFPPEAAALIDDIRTILESIDRDEVVRRREVGLSIIKLVDDVDGTYGRPDFNRIKEALPYQRDTLRPCLELARKFTDREFETLIALRSPTGGRLRWSHFVALTRVGTYDRAKQLATEALAKDMSVKEMIQQQVDSQDGPRSAGGRKPKMPTNPLELAAGVSRACTAFCNQVNAAWFSDTSPDYLSQIKDASQFHRRGVAKALQQAVDKMEPFEDAVLLMRTTIEGLLAAAEVEAEARAA